VVVACSAEGVPRSPHVGGRLPEKIRNVALAAILGPRADNPHRLGKPLLGELEGLYSARRGEYLIISRSSKRRASS
jgi:mRNA-degrading endonuclease RelE of RelBE toxin-antitoxin system